MNDQDPEQRPLELRPELAAAAQLAEREMRKRDATRGKSGWKSDHWFPLLEHLREERLEFDAALSKVGEPAIQHIAAEGGDEIAMTMMVLDQRDALDGVPIPLGYDELRALLIEMRKYVVQHNVQIGECVAWMKLKKYYALAASQEHWERDLAWARAYREHQRASGELPVGELVWQQARTGAADNGSY